VYQCFDVHLSRDESVKTFVDRPKNAVPINGKTPEASFRCSGDVLFSAEGIFLNVTEHEEAIKVPVVFEFLRRW
jgi:hypothetical protein